MKVWDFYDGQKILFNVNELISRVKRCPDFDVLYYNDVNDWFIPNCGWEPHSMHWNQYRKIPREFVMKLFHRAVKLEEDFYRFLDQKLPIRVKHGDVMGIIFLNNREPVMNVYIYGYPVDFHRDMIWLGLLTISDDVGDIISELLTKWKEILLEFNLPENCSLI